jgi:molybdopterin synthase catalytic subunit
MQVEIVLFATLKDAAGQARFPLTLAGDHATVADVRRALGEAYPAVLHHLPSAIAAVNGEFAFPPDAVQAGDEVAFFPPVSGGMSGYPTILLLPDSPISVDALTQAITTPETGAVVAFTGVVRGVTRQGEAMTHTRRLEYEAYARMAQHKMQQVADEMRQHWPRVQGIAIAQRVGLLEVGEHTIVVACAAGHRDHGCFEAARYGIDRVKAIVPVWKKDIRDDGVRWVEGSYRPTPDDRAT